MAEPALKLLSDMTSEAHARIQQAHADINPVVGVRQGMRDMGIPADVMTIDCLTTSRRILLVLHDDDPGVLLYQFANTEEEIGTDFRRMTFADVSAQTLFDWMEGYLGRGSS